jgi:alkylated DNA repair protein (DNA oxidative demethylase)
MPTFRHLPGHLSREAQIAVLADISAVITEAPLFTPVMPRTGKPFSVRMSNCGALGWVSDKERGYRYQATHPVTGRPWPAMPERLLALWRALAEFSEPPEACLINIYGPGAKMGAHQDRDEDEPAAPVLSVSLGDDATFHVGGLRRTDPKTRMRLASGDVVLLEGDSRFLFHGIDRVFPGTSTLVPGGGRINLTLRRVTRVRAP